MDANDFKTLLKNSSTQDKINIRLFLTDLVKDFKNKRARERLVDNLKDKIHYLEFDKSERNSKSDSNTHCVEYYARIIDRRDEDHEKNCVSINDIKLKLYEELLYISIMDYEITDIRQKHPCGLLLPSYADATI